MDYDYDRADPFADMDYDEIMAWARENRYLSTNIAVYKLSNGFPIILAHSGNILFSINYGSDDAG